MGIDINKLREDANKKAAPSTKGIDIRQLRATQSDRIDPYAQGFNPGVMRNFDVNEFKFQPTFDGDNYRKRAELQGFGESLAKGAGNTVANAILGLGRDVGYLAELGGWIAGKETDFSNELIEGTERLRNPFGEVYRINPNKVWDPTDSAWWINNVGQVAESVGTFALEGWGLGKLFSFAGTSLAKGLGNSKTLLGLIDDVAQTGRYFKQGQSLDDFGQLGVNMARTDFQIQQAEAKIVSNFMQGTQRGAHLANSFTLAYIEGAQIANNVYKEVYTKQREQGVDESTAKRIAAESASITAKWNTALIGLTNLAVLAPLHSNGQGFFKKTAEFELRKGEALPAYITRLEGILADPKTKLSIFKPKSLKKLVALESGQEFIEEAGINNFAEYNGNWHGKNVEATYDEESFNTNTEPKPDYIKGLTKRIFSSQALLEGMLGALGGAGQSLILGSLKNQKVYDPSNPGKVLEKISRITQENRLKEEFVARTLKELQEDVSSMNDQLAKVEVLADKNDINSKWQREELLNRLFIPVTLKAVMGGNANLFINSYENLKNIDNTTDLGIKAKEELDQLIKDKQELESTGVVDTTIDNRIEAAQQRLDLVKGKTEAMVKGFADNTNDNRYKDKADLAIAVLKEMDGLSEELERTYSFELDDQLSGYAKAIYLANLRRVYSDVNHKFYSKTKEMYEQLIIDELTALNVDEKAQNHMLKTNRLKILDSYITEAQQEYDAFINKNTKEAKEQNKKLKSAKDTLDFLTKELLESEVDVIVAKIDQSRLNEVNVKNLEGINKNLTQLEVEKNVALERLTDLTKGDSRKEWIANWKVELDLLREDAKQHEKALMLGKIVKTKVEDLDKLVFDKNDKDLTDLVESRKRDHAKEQADELKKKEAQAVIDSAKKEAEEVITVEPEVIVDPETAVVVEAEETVKEEVIEKPKRIRKKKSTTQTTISTEQVDANIVVPGLSSNLNNALSLFDTIPDIEPNTEQVVEQIEVITPTQLEQEIAEINERRQLILDFAKSKEAQEIATAAANAITALVAISQISADDINTFIKSEDGEKLIDTALTFNSITGRRLFTIDPVKFDDKASIYDAILTYNEYINNVNILFINKQFDDEIDNAKVNANQKPLQSFDLTGISPTSDEYINAIQAFMYLINQMSTSMYDEHTAFTLQQIFDYINDEDPSMATLKKYERKLMNAAKILLVNQHRADEHSLYQQVMNRLDFTQQEELILTNLPKNFYVDTIMSNKDYNIALGVFTSIVNKFDANNYLEVTNFIDNQKEILNDHQRLLLEHMLYNPNFGSKAIIRVDKEYKSRFIQNGQADKYSYEATKNNSNLVPVAVFDHATGLKIGQIVTIPYIVMNIINAGSKTWFDTNDLHRAIERNYNALYQLYRGVELNTDEWDQLMIDFKETYNVNRKDNPLYAELDRTNIDDYNKIVDAITHMAKVMFFGSTYTTEHTNLDTYTNAKEFIEKNLANQKAQVISTIEHTRRIRQQVLSQSFVTSLHNVHGGTVLKSNMVTDGGFQLKSNLLDTIVVLKQVPVTDINGNEMLDEKGNVITRGLPIEDRAERLKHIKLYFKPYTSTDVSGDITISNIADDDDTMVINTNKSKIPVLYVRVQGRNHDIPMQVFRSKISELGNSEEYINGIILEILTQLRNNVKGSALTPNQMGATLASIIQEGGTKKQFIFNTKQVVKVQKEAGKSDSVSQATFEILYEEGESTKIVRSLKVQVFGNVVTLFKNVVEDNKDMTLESLNRAYDYKNGIKLESNPDLFHATLANAISQQTRSFSSIHAKKTDWVDPITKKTYDTYTEYLIATEAVKTDVAAYVMNGVPISNIGGIGWSNLRAEVRVDDLQNRAISTADNNIRKGRKQSGVVKPKVTQPKKIPKQVRAKKSTALKSVVPIDTKVLYTFEEAKSKLSENDVAMIEALHLQDTEFILITDDNRFAVIDYLSKTPYGGSIINLINTSNAIYHPSIPNLITVVNNKPGVIPHELIHRSIRNLTIEQQTALEKESVEIFEFIKQRIQTITNANELRPKDKKEVIPPQVLEWVERLETSDISELYTYIFEYQDIAKWLANQKYDDNGKEKSTFRVLIEKLLNVIGGIFDGSILDKMINTLESYVATEEISFANEVINKLEESQLNIVTIEVTDNGRTINDVETDRVTNRIPNIRVENDFNETIATKVGTEVDGALRQMLDGQQYIPLNNVDVSDEAYEDLLTISTELYEWAAQNDVTLYAKNTVLFDLNAKISGEFDIIAVHNKEKKVSIIDIKTSLKSKTSIDTAYYTKYKGTSGETLSSYDSHSNQVSVYAHLFEQQTGYKVENIYVLPLTVSYIEAENILSGVYIDGDSLTLIPLTRNEQLISKLFNTAPASSKRRSSEFDNLFSEPLVSMTIDELIKLKVDTKELTAICGF